MPRLQPRMIVANDCLDAALSYIEDGFTVMPIWPVSGGACDCPKADGCDRPAKHPIPIRRDGRYTWNRITTKERAEVIWGVQRPPNVGIVTGPQSGIFVLDVDAGGDKVGFASLNQLTSQYGELPETREADTGSGGKHVIFRWPASQEVTNSNRNLPPDLDIRGKGGFIVAAPSVTLKGDYYWVDEGETPVADAPRWLLDLLRPPERPQREYDDMNGSTPMDPARLDAYAERVVDQEINKLRALQGANSGWNQGVFQACCNLYEIANSSWNSFNTREIETLIRRNLPVPTDGNPWDGWAQVEGAQRRVEGRQRELPRAI